MEMKDLPIETLLAMDHNPRLARLLLSSLPPRPRTPRPLRRKTNERFWNRDPQGIVDPPPPQSAHREPTMYHLAPDSVPSPRPQKYAGRPDFGTRRAPRPTLEEYEQGPGGVFRMSSKWDP